MNFAVFSERKFVVAFKDNKGRNFLLPQNDRPRPRYFSIREVFHVARAKLKALAEEGEMTARDLQRQLHISICEMQEPGEQTAPLQIAKIASGIRVPGIPVKREAIKHAYSLSA